MQQKINLLKPATLQIRYNIARPSKSVIVLCGSAVLITIFLAVALHYYEEHLTQKKSILQHEIIKLNVQTPEEQQKIALNDELNSMKEFIEGYQKKKLNLSHPIEEISKLVPTDVILTKAEIDPNANTIHLQAVTDQYASVAKFVGNFEKSSLFRKSFITSTIREETLLNKVVFDIIIIPSKDVFK